MLSFHTQSLKLSYGFIYCRNVWKDVHLFTATICCLCVWIHRVPHKSHTEFTSVMLRNRGSNMFAGWCFPGGLWVYVHAAWNTLQPFLWCWQVVYSAGMVNNLSVFFFYRRQSSTINNSAVIKQFLGQWASGYDIFSLNSSQSRECLTNSHDLGFIDYFTQVTNRQFWTIYSHMIWNRLLWLFFIAASNTLRDFFVWLTLLSVTQAVFQVPETVREACIVAAVQFGRGWCQLIMIWVWFMTI